MNKFFERLRLIIADANLRRRILFTLGALVVFRIFASIPIPSIDVLRLERLLDANQFLGLLNIFSGGGLSTLSIVMLGVGPYITASIIMQLVTMVSPKLKAIYQEEGEAGRIRFSQYSRMLSIPLAILQSYGFMMLLINQNVLPAMSVTELIINVIIVASGSVLLMWVGELVSEFGIGNGVSLIIFAGIVASLPTHLAQFIANFNPASIPIYIGFVFAAVAIIAAVVSITEAERPIAVTHARQAHGGSGMRNGIPSYIPLRLNQAGVIPIIFALSILLFPQVILSFLSQSGGKLAGIANNISVFLADPWANGVIYFLLVFVFTYFYTAVTFDPIKIATDLQKRGAFIPGIRPGEHTSSYLGKVVTRITLVGALFLGVIAIMPAIMQGLTGNTALNIGGTALLIVVSVVLDLIKKIDAQASMREY